MFGGFRTGFGSRLEKWVDAAGRRLQRRYNVRHQAVIYPLDPYFDLIIQSVSATTIVGEVDIALQEGQTIHFSLDDKAFRSATVQQVFEHKIVLELQDEMASIGSGESPDCKRDEPISCVNLELPAQLYTCEHPLTATVINVSRTGLALETDTLLPGQDVLVRIGNTPLVPGSVRWARDGKAGIVTKIDVSVLDLAFSEI